MTYFLGNALFKNRVYFDAVMSWEEAYKINPNFRELSRLHNDYFMISNNPRTEGIYSKDDTKTEEFINKLAYPYSAAKVMKKQYYWIYKVKEDLFILYRIPIAAPPTEMTEMMSIIDQEYHSLNSIVTLYSLFGIADNKNEGYSNKKLIVVSHQDFIKLLKEKV